MKNIYWVIVAILVATILIALLIADTASSTIEPGATPQPETISRSTSTSTEDIEQLIKDTANLYGIDEQKFLAVAKCESSLRPSVVGDNGASVGLFQIHLPSHPDVTKELASNPEWATEWSAKKFIVDPTIWTCY